MRRVVVTGMGVISSLGNNKAEVLESLKNGKSGIRFDETQAEMGFRSHVNGPINIDLTEAIDRKILRFMGGSAAYNYIAMQEAVEDAGLTEDQVSNVRSGLITGSGGGSTANIVEAADNMREKGIRRVGPYMVTRTMASTTSGQSASPASRLASTRA